MIYGVKRFAYINETDKAYCLLSRAIVNVSVNLIKAVQVLNLDLNPCCDSCNNLCLFRKVISRVYIIFSKSLDRIGKGILVDNFYDHSI